MTDWLAADSLAPNTAGSLAPLYEAAARGELALPHCAACRLASELEQLRCDRCGATGIDWLRVEPKGSVHSVTTVHRREPGLILAEAPYHVVDVELTSGHRLLMATEGPTAISPRIGDDVTIVFRHVGGVAVPALALSPTEDS